MKQDRVLLGGVLFFILGIVVIGLVYYFVLRPPEAASEPIQAVPLAITAVPTNSAEDTAVSNQLHIYEISQEESEARFVMNELLRGVDTTVVGSTNQIAGQIGANLADLSTAEIGVIQVNARTLLTDNNFRNNAIRNRILFTDAYEFITFAPTDISGLPASAELGQPITFEVTGDLTIRETTQMETFTVTAVPVSATRLKGSATTTIQRLDYHLQIPVVRNVADVSEAVVLEFDFVAVAAN